MEKLLSYTDLSHPVSDQPISPFRKFITALTHDLNLYLADGRKIQLSATTQCIRAI
ncbi:hypothetical protein [Lyngbya sp. PCC 8106]|uniref:hypothetical protein n=1 Tax=Lyngbya sp. (strain PCC 8106) TaxID=313612 RepID=UPI00031BF32A|nr:hypothetical protein [Lyngbya sp. PCC 8106]